MIFFIALWVLVGDVHCGGVGAFVHTLPCHRCASRHSGAVDRGGCSRHGDIIGWSYGHIGSGDIRIGQAGGGRDH